MNNDFMKPIIDLFSTEMRTAVDNGIMKAVYDVGVNVDKERLLQALKDARAFWHEGYEAGRRGRPEWISVEERLPEKRDDVLVLTWDCDIYIADYIPTVKQWWIVDDLRIDISHWMPLPEPPEVDA